MHSVIDGDIDIVMNVCRAYTYQLSVSLALRLASRNLAIVICGLPSKFSLLREMPLNILGIWLLLIHVVDKIFSFIMLALQKGLRWGRFFLFEFHFGVTHC